MILRARLILPISAPPIEDGALVIRKGRIVAVGRWSDLRNAQKGRPTDAGEAIILPGFVNAHCHLDYTDMGGLLPPPRLFPDWIKGLVALKASWSYSEYAASWLHGARMLLESGVTTVADIEAVPELLPEVWAATPLRIFSFLELLNVKEWLRAGAIVRQAEDQGMQLARKAPKNRCWIGLSPHAPYTTSPDLIRAVAAAARKHGWLLTTHLAESREEFDMFARGAGPLHNWLAPQRGGVPVCGSPTRYIASAGLPGPDLIAAHANYLAPGDARLLGDHGVSVAHCPRCHAYMGHERFPLQELASNGVNVCLGTDSLASVRRQGKQRLALDFPAELRQLASREPGLSAAQILRMATWNGARALRREEDVGHLATGTFADLITIPHQGPTREAEEAVINHRGPVASCMIGGRWVFPARFPRHVSP